jgi:hypothetical protein
MDQNQEQGLRSRSCLKSARCVAGSIDRFLSKTTRASNAAGTRTDTNDQKSYMILASDSEATTAPATTASERGKGGGTPPPARDPPSPQVPAPQSPRHQSARCGRRQEQQAQRAAHLYPLSGVSLDVLDRVANRFAAAAALAAKAGSPAKASSPERTASSLAGPDVGGDAARCVSERERDGDRGGHRAVTVGQPESRKRPRDAIAQRDGLEPRECGSATDCGTRAVKRQRTHDTASTPTLTIQCQKASES